MKEQDNLIGVNLLSSKKQFHSFAYKALDRDDFGSSRPKIMKRDRF